MADKPGFRLQQPLPEETAPQEVGEEGFRFQQPLSPKAAQAVLDAQRDQEPKFRLLTDMVGAPDADTPGGMLLSNQRDRVRLLTEQAISNKGEINPSILDWLRADFSHFGKQAWSGYIRGEHGFWRMLDNAADFVSDVTGLDRNEFTEYMKRNAESQVVSADTLTDTIVQGVFQLPGEALTFLTGRGLGNTFAAGAKTVGQTGQATQATARGAGLFTVGAVREADRGPLAALHGGVNFVFFDTFARATAALPLIERSVFGGATFGSLAAAQGGSTQDIVANAALGVVLPSLSKSHPQAQSSMKPLADKVVTSRAWRNYLERRADKQLNQAEAILEGQRVGMDFLRERYPSFATHLEAADVGKIRVRVGSTDEILQNVSQHLDKRLNLSPEQAAPLTIQTKLQMILERADPDGVVPQNVKDAMTNQFLKNVFEARQISMAAAGARGGKQARSQPVESRDPKVAEQNARDVERAFQKSRDAADRANALFKRSILSRAKVALIDQSGPMKGELLKRAGDEGKRAVMMHELIQGASMRANARFQEFEKSIYDGLNSKQISALDEIIRSRRIVQIDQIHGVGKIKHEFGIDGNKAADALAQRRFGGRNLSDEEFRILMDRADGYFAATNDVLELMHKEGLLTDRLFERLKNFDYSETQFLSQIDNITTVEIGGRKINVTDSGIEQLKSGAAGGVMMDSRELLAQLVGRAYNRIARNDANKALLEVARLNPQNGVARTLPPDEVAKLRQSDGTLDKVKVPRNHFLVKAVVEGKQEPLFIRSDYYDQWVTSNPQMTRNMANFLRLSSGTAVVKPLATGYNPGFVLTNLPRDMLHVWFSTGEYSRWAPIYGLQLGKDMISVAPDAFLRRGRFDEFINEGGGMQFLAHQGRDILASRSMFREFHPTMRRTREVLGYLNETSEIWVRLALRDRAIQNGKSGQEATWIARNYLDFAQGGTMSKGIDNFMPYFNAAIQGVRGVARQSIKDPSGNAVKAVQLMGVAGWLAYANSVTNPESWAQVDQREKEGNFVFTTPYFVFDNNGNKRWLYFNVKKDQTLVPFTALAEAVMHKHLTGEAPDVNVSRIMKESIPFMNVSIPSLEALFTYASNYDAWFEDEVWRGPETNPSEEFLIAPNRPTSQLAVDISQFARGSLGAELSPARLERSFKKIVPSNTFTGILGEGWQAAFGGADEFELAQTQALLLAQRPFVRRVAKFTHPAAVPMQELEEIRKNSNSELVRQNRDLDNLIFKNEQGTATKDDIRSWLGTQPPQDRERLANRWLATIAVDKTFKRFGTDGVPPRLWWINAAGLPSDVRAAVFHMKREEAPPEAKSRMDKIAAALTGGATGLGFANREFMHFYGVEKQLYGSSAEGIDLTKSLRGKEDDRRLPRLQRAYEAQP